MANNVLIKRSAVPSKVPTTGDLQLGELAVNTYDGKLYMKKDNGTASVIEIGAGGGGGTNTYTQSATAPASPSVGDRWLDTDNGIEYTWLTDADGGQWVETGGASGGNVGRVQLLGTAITTSGTSHTVSGLDLTPYTELKILWNAVSTNASTQTLRIQNQTATPVFTSVAQGMFGVSIIDLRFGYFRSFVYPAATTNTETSQSPTIYVGRVLITNASTSITFDHAGGATFNNGTIEVYGVR